MFSKDSMKKGNATPDIRAVTQSMAVVIYTHMQPQYAGARGDTVMATMDWGKVTQGAET